MSDSDADLAKRLRDACKANSPDDVDFSVIRGVASSLECRSEDARLAAAAPDMARVLLALEWSRPSPLDETVRTCPVCLQHDIGRPHAHAPDCALDTALSKAGVLR